MKPKKQQNNIRYLKNLKDNYVSVIPATFALAVTYFVIMAYFNFGLECINSIDGDNGKILGLLVLMITIMQLVSWIGRDTFNTWANHVYSAIVNGNN